MQKDQYINQDWNNLVKICIGLVVILLLMASELDQIRDKQVQSIVEEVKEDRLINYHEIANQFILRKDLFDRNNIQWHNFYQRIINQPAKHWKILSSPPNSTLLPYIHIPKTAGSTWRRILNTWRLSAKEYQDNYKYANSMWPTRHWKSFNSPGCQEKSKFGGTHCSFSEISKCINEDLANFYDFHDEYFDVNGQIRLSGEIGRPDHLLDKRVRNFDPANIKYSSVIRHPIIRVISEYYWWRVSYARNNYTSCAHAWPNSLCSSIQKGLEAWVRHPNNTAHNRQTRSLFSESPKNVQISKTNRCYNVNGEYVLQHFGDVTKLNNNIEMIKNVIKNIDSNFVFLAVLDEWDLSENLAKIIYNFVPKGGLGKRELFQVKLYRRKSREKRAMHKTKGRPVAFRTSLLNEIMQRNKLDMVLYHHVLKKLDASVEYYI